jgi:hypothetical protein
MVSPAVAVMCTKRKARTDPWSPLDHWEEERHKNLAQERRNRRRLAKRNEKYSEEKNLKKAHQLTNKTTYSRKYTSTERDRRSKQVEMSVSGRKLNLYLDSLDWPLHMDDVIQSTSGTNDTTRTEPQAYRVRGLPLVHFVPIIIAIKDPLKRGRFTVTRGISGTNTDQYYLRNQDSTLSKREAVFLDWRKSDLLDRTSVCAIDSLA